MSGKADAAQARLSAMEYRRMVLFMAILPVLCWALVLWATVAGMLAGTLIGAAFVATVTCCGMLAMLHRHRTTLVDPAQPPPEWPTVLALTLRDYTLLAIAGQVLYWLMR